MLVQTSNLSKVYAAPRGRIHAVDGIDLEVRPGEFLAVCGRSGSGKSTLLGMLGGLCRPSAGEVRVEGVALWSLRPGALADFRARRFGFMFQFAGLLPNLRAIDNVALPALLAGAAYHAAYDRARELLDEVGLAGRWDAHPGELSGGQQRRTALARALVNRPVLLLADEPTNDLDEQAEQEVLSLLRRLHRVHGATLVVVTHDPHLACQADRVIHLRNGKPVGIDVPEAAALTPFPALPAASPACLVGEESSAGLAPGEPTPPGAGLGRFLIGFIGWVLLVAAGMWGVDHLAARWQRKEIVRQHQARKLSRETALQQLRANVEEVSYRADGGYEAVLYINNPDPKKPFYVLGPSPRVFAQVGRSWQELPATAKGFAGGVHEVAGKHLYRISFRADLQRYEELIKGYLHLRISSVMVVGDSPEPSDDVFQRTDDYYVYLKPQTVSDDEVRRRNGWKEGALVPPWIAMPSH
jgi:putative ABC transport system ATP-binding protein/macrolide transport system ATP-binding/permease protein/lipoprotein-releasing system ATP-binding protein